MKLESYQWEARISHIGLVLLATISMTFGSVCQKPQALATTAPSNFVNILHINALDLFIQNSQDVFQSASMSYCPATTCLYNSSSDLDFQLIEIANIIDTLSPDIIQICKISSCDTLSTIISYLSTPNSYYPYFFGTSGSNANLPINTFSLNATDAVACGLISRVATYNEPVKRTNSHSIDCPVENSFCPQLTNSSWTPPPQTIQSLYNFYAIPTAFSKTPVVLIGANLIRIINSSYPPEMNCFLFESQLLYLANIVNDWRSTQRYDGLFYEVIVMATFDYPIANTPLLDAFLLTSGLVNTVDLGDGDFAGTTCQTNTSEVGYGSAHFIFMTPTLANTVVNEDILYGMFLACPNSNFSIFDNISDPFLLPIASLPQFPIITTLDLFQLSQFNVAPLISTANSPNTLLTLAYVVGAILVIGIMAGVGVYFRKKLDWRIYRDKLHDDRLIPSNRRSQFPEDLDEDPMSSQVEEDQQIIRL